MKVRKNAKLIAAMVVLVAVATGIHYASNYLSLSEAPSQLWNVSCGPLHPEAKSSDNDITIVVSSDRTYGIRVGQPICVKIQATAAASVDVSIDTLKAGVLTRDDTDFELVAAPMMTTSTDGDKTTREINLLIRFWSTSVDPSPFQAEFLYKSGEQIWQYGKTPPVQFTRSKTAPMDETMLVLQEGPVDKVPLSIPPSGWILLFVGLYLVVFPLVWLVWRFVVHSWQKAHPPYVPTEEEVFWLTTDAIKEDANWINWHPQHYEAIAAAFLKYFKSETASLPQMQQMLLSLRSDFHSIINARGLFDRELYTMHPLDQQKREELFRELEAIIPRPVRKVKRQRRFRLTRIRRK